MQPLIFVGITLHQFYDVYERQSQSLRLLLE